MATNWASRWRTTPTSHSIRPIVWKSPPPSGPPAGTGAGLAMIWRTPTLHLWRHARDQWRTDRHRRPDCRIETVQNHLASGAAGPSAGAGERRASPRRGACRDPAGVRGSLTGQVLPSPLCQDRKRAARPAGAGGGCAGRPRSPPPYFKRPTKTFGARVAVGADVVGHRGLVQRL